MQDFVQNLLNLQNEKGVGKAYFLTGINGVGKTTLLHNLKKDFDAKKIKVSLSSQKPLVTLKHWRVKDLLDFAHTTLEFYIDKKNVQNFSYEMGMDKYLSTPVMKLSGGENQVLKLYLCLILKADFYFLDEPTTYLDTDKRSFLIKLIQDLKFQGKKFLVVEHDSDFVKKLNDQEWIMNPNGQISCEGVSQNV